MLNFKTYKEAEEFNRNNHPVQKREVLVEKYSLFIIDKKNRNFFKEILHKKHYNEEESLYLANKRREYIMLLTGISHFSKDYNFDFICVTNPYSYVGKKYKDDSDLSSIYELF